MMSIPSNEGEQCALFTRYYDIAYVFI